jgi:acetyl-CoA carboxylase carboxyl transferase subunit beta
MPDWHKCPGCQVLIYVKRLDRNLLVCPECGHHGRLGARARIEQLTDHGTFKEMAGGIAAVDPLGFSDLRPYRERLAEAAVRTGEPEAVVAGAAEIDGVSVVVLAMEFGFMGGSMGRAVGEAVVTAVDLAMESHQPFVAVCASGGARMQEGAISLFQMARTSHSFALLHEAGLFSICILTDPTFGGVAASFAMLGGILVAEAGAMVGFAGPRVIEQTIRQRLPEGLQVAERLFAQGLVDRVETRAALRPLVGRLLRLHAAPRDPAPRPATGSPALRSPDALRRRDPWEVVRGARQATRPTALDHLATVFVDFCELRGDRQGADDPAIVGGPARLGGRTVMVVAHQKGHTTNELAARNFGMPHPEGYRKAVRLFEYAERYSMPVVTLIDTPGAYPGIGAEQRGQAGAIAYAIMRLTRLRVPVLSVVTGEGGSGGALALAVADRLFIMENAFLSVISPEGCAAILWHTTDAAPAAARALRITPADLLSLGLVDGVVPEPASDPAHARSGANLARALQDGLAELDHLTPTQLLQDRARRLRSVARCTGTEPAAGGQWLAEVGA